VPATAHAALISWSVPWWLATVAALASAIYIRGWQRFTKTTRERFPNWRLVSFEAGLLTLGATWASPLHALTHFLLIAHMVEHLLLLVVAPPLILLGYPAIPLLRGLPEWAARGINRHLLQRSSFRWFGRFITHPVFAGLLMVMVTLAWHIPLVFDRAWRSMIWHQACSLSFLASGLLFWWPVIVPWPSLPQWPRWAIPPYLLIADLTIAALSAYLAFCGQVVYPDYASVPRLFGISALNDQVAAAMLMWVVMMMVFLGAAVIVTLGLLAPSALPVLPQGTAMLGEESPPHQASCSLPNCRSSYSSPRRRFPTS
jgi:putative membrane protein